MKKIAEQMKESFVKGVQETVSAMEKNASFQSWMKHPRFREKFASATIGLVKKIKGQSR